MGADEPHRSRMATTSPNPSSLARGQICRQTPEVGAVCPNWARTDLCGGRSAMGVPTAIHAQAAAGRPGLRQRGQPPDAAAARTGRRHRTSRQARADGQGSTQAAQQDDQPHAGAGRARLCGVVPAGRQVRAGDDAGAQCAGDHAAVRGLQRAQAGVAGQERRSVRTARVRGKTPSRGTATAGTAAGSRHPLLV
jgi:hypothetical protein